MPGSSGCRTRMRNPSTISSMPATTRTRARFTNGTLPSPPAPLPVRARGVNALPTPAPLSRRARGDGRSVFLKVYADDKLIKTESQEPKADKTYAFVVKLKPGLIQYKVEFGTKRGNTETILHTVTNLVCGDAYLIDGQSNAVSTDWAGEASEYSSPWIRSFGSTWKGISAKAGAMRSVAQGGQWQIGYWGMDLARHLVESQKIPICIINGARGRNADRPASAEPGQSARMRPRSTARCYRASGKPGLRTASAASLWHQGEADQGADGPDGGYGWETYQQYFVDMSAGWKQDMPNIQHYYLFQIWPNACSQGGTRQSDKLRDVQRLCRASTPT